MLGQFQEQFGRSEFTACPTNIITIDAILKGKVALRSVATTPSSGHGKFMSNYSKDR